MLTAVMIHPPLFGATLKSFDAAKAKAVKGVVDVVSTPRGIAVVAETMWAAMKGRDAVTAEWDEAKAEKRSYRGTRRVYRELASKPGAVARDEGDVEGALAKAAKVIEATFEFPYLAHAAMEPMNAVARRADDGTIEVWGGHQMPDLYQAAAAQAAETTPDKVRLHVMKTGGGFGRRAVPDARRHRGGRLGRPRRLAGARRSRCNGPARTTCAAGATGRCTSTPSKPDSTPTDG